MGYIDVDSHVVETEDTWSYMEPGERMYRPRLAQIGVPDKPGAAPPTFWLAGDTWARELPPDGNVHGNANVFRDGTLTLEDVGARIDDLDALGIDFQVLISTFWIGVEINNAVEEAALARSYNRWMAERVSDSGGRLGWNLRPPIRLMDRALEELEFGRDHGAVGIHLHGVETGYYLSDPYLYPLYEKAQDLDLAIVVHLGAITRVVPDLPIGRIVPRPEAMMWHAHSIMAGFHSVISSDLPERFPYLRWGFVEGGTTWTPAVLHQHARLRAIAGEFLRVEPITGEELAAKNIFVACEADEDLPYLADLLSDEVMVAGTDYGHNDIGSELGIHSAITDRPDVPEALARRITDANGRRLYGVSDTFLPAPTVTGITPMAVLPHISGAVAEDTRAFVTYRR